MELQKIKIKPFIVFAAFIVIIYISACFYLYFNQEDMIFFTQSINKNSLSQLKDKYKDVEDISIRTIDGFKINGWLVKNERIEKSPLVICFGGNAEEVSHLIGEQDKFSGWSIGLINYRGYGLSEGRPSEKAFFNDAIQIYDYFSNRKDIDANKIVVMGRSIGSGVAVYLAANRNVKGIILATPYDSFVNLSQEKVPFAPVRIILKHRFDSLSRAPSIKRPLLELVAGNDEVIPPYHAKKLSEKWSGTVKYIVIGGENHNSISSNKLYWKEIKEFLDKF